MGFTHLQIEWNPCLDGYCPQIPFVSALCPQLNLLNTPPPPKKIPGYATGCKGHDYDQKEKSQKETVSFLVIRTE
jgi:hypothetical protein